MRLGEIPTDAVVGRLGVFQHFSHTLMIYNIIAFFITTPPCLTMVSSFLHSFRFTSFWLSELTLQSQFCTAFIFSRHAHKQDPSLSE